MSNSMLGDLVSLPTSRNGATPPISIRTNTLGFLFPYSPIPEDPAACKLRVYNVVYTIPLTKATLDSLAIFGSTGIDLTPTPAPVFDPDTQSWHTPQV
jgi:hypothetical protein